MAMELSKFERVATMATNPSQPHRKRKFRLDIPQVMDDEEQEIAKHVAAWLAYYGILGEKDVEIRFSDSEPRNPGANQIVLTRELCHKNMLDAQAEARKAVVALIATGSMAKREQETKRVEQERVLKAPPPNPEMPKHERIKLFCACPPPDNFIWDDEVGEGMTMECRKCGSWFTPPA